MIFFSLDGISRQKANSGDEPSLRWHLFQVTLSQIALFISNLSSIVIKLFYILKIILFYFDSLSMIDVVYFTYLYTENNTENVQIK